MGDVKNSGSDGGGEAKYIPFSAFALHGGARLLFCLPLATHPHLYDPGREFLRASVFRLVSYLNWHGWGLAIWS